MPEIHPSNRTVFEYRFIGNDPGYRVGSDGSAWTCLTRIVQPGKMGVIYVPGPTWRELARNPRGKYLTVTLRERRRPIHHLVLEAFVGPRPAGMEGCHNDGDPTNNRLDNLRWDTSKANQADKTKHGTMSRGESNGQSKLTTEKVHAIRTESAIGAGARKLAARHGVSRSLIRQVISRKTWKHVPE